MSSCKSLLLLQNYRCKSNLINHNLSTYFGSKYHLASSVTTTHIQKIDASENIQPSKYVQPFINSSVDEILSIVNLKSTSVKQSVSMLKALRMHTLFNGIDSAAFKNDKRFEILCQIFEMNCNRIEPNLLISGLRSLLEVGISPYSPCVISAEENIIKNLHKFSTFNMICCLYFHHKFMKTDLQKKVVSLLIKEIQVRTSEIVSNSEVLMLVHILKLFDKEYKKKLEQRIVEFIPSFNVHQMAKILTTLSENSDRNIFIINAVSFHMRHKSESPSMKEIVDILYAFKNLNFCDPLLLPYLLKITLSSIPSIEQPSLISGILTTCGHLRWKDPVILDACGEWIVEHLDSCRLKEFVAYILSIATLNYLSPKSEKVLKLILPHLTHEKLKSDIWLDIVWSLAILKYASKEMLEYVISKEFYQPLIDGSHAETVSNKLKLMNLKAVLKMNHPECIFGCNLFFEPIVVTHSMDIENGRRHVTNVLSNFVPKNKFMCTNQNTEMGIFIDAEFIMDKSDKPLSLAEYGTMANTIHITKPLPEGAKRISLLVLFHKDFTLHNQSLTGSSTLAARLLSAQGFSVVLIPFSKFMENKTEVQKAKFLMQKIKNVMKSTTDIHN